MSKLYFINEIFYSIQGEGYNAGKAAVFVRFAGCNLDCQMAPGMRSPGGFICDTDFSKKEELTAAQIQQRMLEVGGRCRRVIFTGGEPCLQLDQELTGSLLGWVVWIESNGTLPIPPHVDYVACSPKTSLWPAKVDELRLVITADPLSWPDWTLYDGVAERYYLSPAYVDGRIDPGALEACVNLVKKDPRWRLSIQQHKIWKVR